MRYEVYFFFAMLAVGFIIVALDDVVAQKKRECTPEKCARLFSERLRTLMGMSNRGRMTSYIAGWPEVYSVHLDIGFGKKYCDITLADGAEFTGAAFDVKEAIIIAVERMAKDLCGEVPPH